MKLWEINDQIEAVLANVASAGGELDETTEAALNELELQLQEKLLACGLYYQGEMAEAAAIDAMAKQLAARAKSHKARAEWLLGYMDRHAPPDEKFSIRDPRVEIKWSKSERVEPIAVEDERFEGVDKDYVKMKVTWAIDKVKARETLKAGKPVKGLQLVKHRGLRVSPRVHEIEGQE